jgi:tetratricopeptide (TPR) repeat protein
LLREAWERVRRESRCELATIVGDAGIGKSRLITEALASLDDVNVVRGRCLPYGEGITYWPVVEVLQQLGTRPPDDDAAAAIRSLLGETEAVASAEEIAWAFRKTLEHAATERPLLAVFDDIQWGEETFLDLIEHVALLSSSEPVLLVCMSRPELTERRPTWPVTVRLDPLRDEDVETLIPIQIAGESRERIADAAGGNPLFISEMLAMAGDDGEVVVPPTLQALLSARLDQLEPGERRVLECAAIEGEIFHRGAVQALAPDEPAVTPRLAALVRRQLIKPDKAQIPGDDGFRFRHLLIRDAAYEALPKTVRAELHQRFAAWLEERVPELVELDELLGHHLEQAARYRSELGSADTALAERAGDLLAAAGRRALWRGDERAARTLLERALELIRPLRLDVHLELDYTLVSSVDRREALVVAEAVAERARAAGDERAELVARVVAENSRGLLALRPDVDELERLVRTVVPLLEQAGDHVGLMRVWLALAGVAQFRAQWADCANACEQAIRHSQLAGQHHTGLFAGFALALANGPRPADQALEALDALGDAPNPPVLLVRAWLLAMLGRFPEWQELAARQHERLLELTGEPGHSLENLLAIICSLAGDHEAAAAHLRASCDWLEKHDRHGELSTEAPQLGRELCALGRYDEAEPLAQLGRELGDPRDLATQMLWRETQALVLSHRGEHAQAEALAREAVALGEQTDAPDWQADALCDLAEVLEAAGRREEALAAFEQALERCERKKNVAMAAQVRARLAAQLPFSDLPSVEQTVG